MFKEGSPGVAAFNECDVEIQCTKGTGPGGQHKNKTESAVRAIHKPSGESVFIQTSRSQHKNKAEAIRLLRTKVESADNANKTQEQREDRKGQIGTGQRGDKVRTVQVQNNRVTNHINGKKVSYDRYSKGEIWRIH